ncbi:hypothetical protein D3C76_1788200 [compost metagenome]
MDVFASRSGFVFKHLSADGVEGSRRSVALALSRMADGVHLLVERALDHHEALAQAKVQPSGLR